MRTPESATASPVRLRLGGDMRLAKAFGIFMIAAVVTGVIAIGEDIRSYITIISM